MSYKLRISFIIPAVLCLAVLICLVPGKAFAKEASPELSNPVISEAGVTTWDCVWFGHYPQGADGNGGFVVEPIKWRVLKVEGNDAYLLADKNIDSMPLCVGDGNLGYECFWHESTLRSWLNGYDASTNKKQIDYSADNFIDKAFTEEEQEAVIAQDVYTNKDSDWGYHHYEYTTHDQVYLLELFEVMNESYGFPAHEGFSVARTAVNTAYTASGGTSGSPYMSGEGKLNTWLLRSPGEYKMYADMITADGGYVEDSSDINPVTADQGIRPVLHLDLTKTDLYSYAGKYSARYSQSIKVNAQFAKSWGDAPFNLNAITDGDSELSYTSADESVATVDQKGNVTPQGVGTAVITVTAPQTDSYLEAVKTVKVIVRKRSPEIEADEEVVKYLGDKAFKLNFSVISDGALSYASDNTSVAAAGADGTVTIVGVGTANITITASETDNCYEASKTVKVTVKKPEPKPVVKKASKITVAKTSAAFKAKKLKKKAQSFSMGPKVNSKAKLTCKKLKGNKKIVVNKTGKVTVRKGLKKGTYKVKVKITSPATKTYKAGSKTVTITIKIK